MFTFIFKGKVYQAETIKELSRILKQAGCKEDVEALYVESFNNQNINSDILEELDEEVQQISDEVQQDEENNFRSAMTALEEQQELQTQLESDLENEPKN